MPAALMSSDVKQPTLLEKKNIALLKKIPARARRGRDS